MIACTTQKESNCLKRCYSVEAELGETVRGVTPLSLPSSQTPASAKHVLVLYDVSMTAQSSTSFDDPQCHHYSLLLLLEEIWQPPFCPENDAL